MQKVDYEKFYREKLKLKITAHKPNDPEGEFKSQCPFCKVEGRAVVYLTNGWLECPACGRSTLENICRQRKVKMPVAEAKKPEPEKEPAVKDLKGQTVFDEKLETYQKKQAYKGKGTFECSYNYKDETGKLRHQTVRLKNPKSFYQRRPYDKALDDKLGNYVKKGIVYNKKKKRIGKLPWVNSLVGIKLVLYRLPELLKSKGQPVLLPEGEKDVDKLIEKGFCSTCNPMGSLKWKASYNVWLAGRDIVLIPDYDPKEKLVGDEHVNRIGNNLTNTAKTIKVLKPKDAKGKRVSDMSVWLASNPDPKQLEKLIIKEAVDFEPSEPTELPWRPEGKGKKKDFNPRPYSNEILKRYKLLFDKHRRFWYYDSKVGIWKENFPLFLNEKLRKEVLEFKHLKKHSLSEIISDLEGLCYIENRPDEPEPYLIPFNNLIYNLETERTLEYNPDYFFINKLKANYNPKAGAYPHIQTFFENIVRKEDIITLKEIIAYCYYRGYPYPKSFWLYGNGANGKSKYAEIIRRIIGKENISGVSLTRLEESQFATWQLYGKLANISPEMSVNVIKNTNMLKSLTGQDLIAMERKFKDPFVYQSYSKLIFLCNEIPWSQDKSFAFYRRVFLLEFPNRFEIALKADPRIIDKIPELEFESLAFECLSLMKDLYSEERNFAFLAHQRTMNVQKEYEKVSDPLGLFLEEKTEPNPEGDIPVIGFNNEYKKWQGEKNLRVWTDHLISRVMSQKGIVKQTLRISKGLSRKDYHFYKAYLELSWK
ncbi:hypothetical protein ES703_17982 [subsurface metagenome]